MTPDPSPSSEPDPSPDEEECGDGVCSDAEEDCPQDCEPSPDCVVSSDCDQGQVCLGGVCVDGDCLEDEDCAEGQACSGNSCVETRVPIINTFAVDPAVAVRGGLAVLRWDVSLAESVEILVSSGDDAPGAVAAVGFHEWTAERDVTFTLTAQNVAGQVQAELPLRVAPSLEITEPSEMQLPAAVAGVEHEVVFAATGGEGALRWALSGTLPAGLTFEGSGNGGLISGVSGEVGVFTFEVEVSDSLAQRAASSHALEVVPAPLAVATMSLPPGVVGQPYEERLDAVGGTPAYHWAAAQGALPPGLTLSDGGVLSGTPEQVGRVPLGLEVRDSAEPPQQAVQALFMEILPAALVLTEADLPEARVGQPYEHRLAAVGGVSPYSFSARGPLPEGLELVGDLLVGTPVEEGLFDLDFEVTDSRQAQATGSYVLNILSGLLTVSTSRLDQAQVGRPYAFECRATGGRLPYTWRVITALPDGLSLSAAGTVSGTPLVEGDFAPVLEVESDDGQTARATVEVEVLPPGLVIVTQALAPARVGTPYFVTLEAEGGTPPYTWSSPALPSGLTLSGEGVIEGVPETQGDFVVEAEVRDGASQRQARGLGLEVAPRAPRIVTSSLPRARVTQPYSVQLLAEFGAAPYGWTLASGALPAGLSLSAQGLLVGSAQELGIFNFRVRMTDGRGETDERSLSLNVEAQPLEILTQSLPDGQLGESYDVRVEVAGGAVPLTFSISGGRLPVGLVLANDRVTGTPAEAGEFSFVLRVSDQSEPPQSVEATLALSVGSEALEIFTQSLPDGRQEQAYGPVDLLTSNGTAPFEWSAQGLPEGIILSPAGRLSGTPSVAGSFVIDLSVTDSNLASGTASLGLVVREVGPASALVAVAGAFVDISSTGRSLSVSSEDDGVSPPLSLGFDFDFFAVAHTEIFVTSNGIVGFSEPLATGTNTALPSVEGPENFIAAFWDDLDPGSGGEVFFEVRGSAPSRRAIIQWSDVDFFLGGGSRMNFEVILYETTHQIQLLYGVSTQGPDEAGRALGNSATIGLEDASQALGVELAFDQEAGALPGQVFLLSPEGLSYSVDGWSAVDGDQQDIAPTAAQALSVDSDDSSELVAIGFDFSFYGETRSDVYISSNGFLTFDPVDSDSYSNVSMPSSATPNAVIAPYWDDLIPRGDSVVYHETFGIAPRRHFVVQWTNWGVLGAFGSSLNFQVVLFETSNHIAVHYGEMRQEDEFFGFQGGSATVGIENSEGTDAVELSFDSEAVVQGASAYFVPASATDTSTYTGVGLSDHFKDIHQLGLRLVDLDIQDDGFETVDIGFDYPFYGQTYSEVTVSTNGFIQFGSADGAGDFVNVDIPSLGAPEAFAAPLWDDLDPSLAGEVYILQDGVSPNRVFTVQWQGVAHNLDGSNRNTFQVILRESDGGMDFNYGALWGSGSASATVGIESADGAVGSAHSFNNSGAVRSGGQVRLIAAP